MSKNSVLFLIAICAAFFSSCSKDKNVMFCEGASTSGDGVNCGTKFESGDVSVILTSEDPFNAKTVVVSVYEFKPDTGRYEKTETINADVKPNASRANVNIPFYAPGKFRVRAYANNTLIGESDIEIAD